MNNKLYIFVLIFLSLSYFSACGLAGNGSVDSYEKCVAAGNVILRSIPPRCVTREGDIFVGPTVNKEGATKPIIQNTPTISSTNSSEIPNKSICKDLCGNNTCEQIVCQAEGCPCAETPVNCPKDCGAAPF
jgi:hypothetical protein